ASPFADGIRRAGEQQTGARGFAFAGLGTRCELVAGVDWFGAAGCTPATGGAGLPERFWSACGSRGGTHATRAAVDNAGTLWVQLAPPGSAAPASASTARLPATRPPAATLPTATLSPVTANATSPAATLPTATLPTAPLTVHGVGAQLTLAQLDRGELLVTTEPVQPGEADAIVVRALSAGLPVVHRVDRLPGGVQALAAGDIDGDGRAEVIAAVRDRAAGKTELWIIN
ncbi:MAG TPA: hypothetical protein VIA18_12580, partial [Polyangia bacterium]|nr:hypothetical protein [Polyangia bacterium]